MTTAFDASFAYTGPLSEEIKAEHAREIERAMFMTSKLANAKLHAGNELQRWVLACNRLVWGEVPADLRQPSPQEAAALLEALDPERRERLLKESQLAAEARHLVALLSEAEVEAHARLEAQQAEEARAEAEARALHEAQQALAARHAAEMAERVEFEAHDAAQKEARFAAWQASRGK